MRFVFIMGFVCAAACGGGGGGGSDGGGATGFTLFATVPENGDTTAGIANGVAITFSQSADLNTLTAANIRLQPFGGAPVGIRVETQAFNSSTARVEPIESLEPNTEYELIVGVGVTSAAGSPLAAAQRICFITESATPTVRPDQLLDLGDRLNVGRAFARGIRLRDGRFMIFGGFIDETDATDTVEIWDPATLSFSVHTSKMMVPRAEHTLTLLPNGRVLIVGGVSTVGGAPLASTEIFDPASGNFAPSAELLTARRWHAASLFASGLEVMVSGGFDAAGERLDSVEVLDAIEWTDFGHPLPVASAQHVQFLHGDFEVYFGVGNLESTAARFTGLEIQSRPEGDIRFRAEAHRVDADRLLIVGGDTRSIVVYDFSSNGSFFARDLLRDRRGAFSLTPRDGTGRRFLAAGGLRISEPGSPPIRSLEIVDYLPSGSFGLPDAIVYTVRNVELPIAMGAHIGFVDRNGLTVLAGGEGGDTGPHLRRVVVIADALTDETYSCR